MNCVIWTITKPKWNLLLIVNLYNILDCLLIFALLFQLRGGASHSYRMCRKLYVVVLTLLHYNVGDKSLYLGTDCRVFILLSCTERHVQIQIQNVLTLEVQIIEIKYRETDFFVCQDTMFLNSYQDFWKTWGNERLILRNLFKF